MIAKHQTPTGFQLVKTIRSHSGHARYLAELSEEPIGWLATCQIEGIPAPYAYSPTVPIWANEEDGRKVIVKETSHRCYQVFALSPQLLRFNDEKKAEDWHIRFSRK